MTLMDCNEEDLEGRVDEPKLGKTTRRQRMTTSDVIEDREHWRELVVTSMSESSTMKT